MRAISLRNGSLHAEILPAAGGGLSRLDWHVGAAPLPVLRPCEWLPGAPKPTPSQLACFPMLPWANRLGGGGFTIDGRFIALAPNRPGDPYPIHGDGWQYPWDVREQSASHALLALDRGSAVPFSYEAQLRYVLEDAALHVFLEVRNTGAERMPFGLGLHPWLPRSAGVMLRAPASSTWTTGPDRLPLEQIPVPAHWDFSAPRHLPNDGIDNVFRGWDGQAEVVWPESGMTLNIAADMGYYIVYAPPGAGFFCIEPVDHAINAHHLPGGAQHNGLTLLAPGQTLARRCSFGVFMGAPA